MPHAVCGTTLVELIVFILIVGVAAGAILSLYAGTTKRSSTPLIEKQAMAIAESLMEEIRLMPFTFCDPDDPNVFTPSAVCTTAEGMGPELAQGETRYAALTPFDNVNDYDGFAMPGGICAGICDITGTAIAGLAAYAAAVAVAPLAFGPAPAIPATDALQITVTVTHPSGVAVTLTGIRTRYAPNL